MSRVAVQIQGGLGNQLFQVAAGLVLARRLACPLEVDLRLLAGSRRRFELGDLGSDVPLIEALPPLPPLRPGAVAAMRRRLERFLPHRVTCIDETDAPLQLLEGLPNGRYYLRGYWQDADIACASLDLLAAGLRVSLERRHAPSERIAAHIRRGDYQSDAKAASVHGTQSAAYYSAGIALLRDRLGGLPVTVFSDDPDWAAAALETVADIEIVEPGSALQDLLRMAGHSGHVISNSTFGWWGAFLSRSQHVVAPAQWWRDPFRAEPRLFPDDWTRL